jgi:hypothetical protein
VSPTRTARKAEAPRVFWSSTDEAFALRVAPGALAVCAQATGADDPEALATRVYALVDALLGQHRQRFKSPPAVTLPKARAGKRGAVTPRDAEGAEP